MLSVDAKFCILAIGVVLFNPSLAAAPLSPPTTALASRSVATMCALSASAIRVKAIPYQVPVSQELSGRLGAVLQVVYLIFNEG